MLVARLDDDDNDSILLLKYCHIAMCFCALHYTD